MQERKEKCNPYRIVSLCKVFVWNSKETQLEKSQVQVISGMTVHDGVKKEKLCQSVKYEKYKILQIFVKPRN